MTPPKAVLKTPKNSVVSHREPASADALASALVEVQKLQSLISETLRETHEKVRQLEVLNSLASILNSTLDTQVVREKALEATCELLGCETASLLLVDPDTNELFWETALGEGGKKLKAESKRLAIDDASIAGSVAKSGVPMNIEDVSADPRHNRAAASKSGFKVRTMLCAPLWSKGKIIGVIQALNRHDGLQGPQGWSVFTDHDMSLFQTLSHQVATAVENARLYTDLKNSFYDTVEALAESIEKKDRYTGGHTKRVVHYSTCIAKYLDLSPEGMERVKLAALLHDVGKIGVEDKILKKEAPLDQVEWKVMQKHPELGCDILSRVKSLKDVVGGMKFHHERWDGKGYPSGLKGEDIPFLARVIAVADTYDAMVSTRPYRRGMDPQVAYDEIVRHAGTQFDPTVVEAFKKAFVNEKMGRGSGSSKLSNCD